MNVTMEELLPVVGKLTEKYTGLSSTSVTYETAHQLMEAVLYCLREAETEAKRKAMTEGRGSVVPVSGSDSDLWLMYQQGYQVVLEKTVKAKKVYEQVISDFRSFGNCCYEDTVMNGMPEFFVRYDARFRPQDHLLTLDYPILQPMGKRKGIDAIYFYLSCILLEQRFLKKFPEPYARKVLEHYHEDYEEMIFNVASVILRNVEVHMMMGTKLSENTVTAEDMERFCGRVKGLGRQELETGLRQLLEQLMGGAGGDKLLLSYLSFDGKEFAADLINAAEYGYMERFIV